MAKTPLLFLSVLILAILLSMASASGYSAPTKPKASNFIKSSCSSTTYPQTCIASLAIFSPKIRNNDHDQLAMTSLLVSLSRARSAKLFVGRYLRAGSGLSKRELGAVKDCFEELDDVEDRLDRSVKEMKGLGKKRKGPEFDLSVSNVLTWVSAAVTDENTCVDGFAGKIMEGKAKTAIRARAVSVIEVTSNALALCNLYAKKMM